MSGTADFPGEHNPKRKGIQSCESCHCCTGRGFSQELQSFREHRVCGACATAWPRLDKFFGREATFKEFCNPPAPTMLVDFPIAGKAQLYPLGTRIDIPTEPLYPGGRRQFNSFVYCKATGKPKKKG